MTSHPIPENRLCWWLTCGKERRLHAIRGNDVTSQEMRDAIDYGLPVPARAVCGVRRRWWMPGLFSRFGRRRCTACCLVLGIPAGKGTPANDTSGEGR